MRRRPRQPTEGVEQMGEKVARLRVDRGEQSLGRCGRMHRRCCSYESRVLRRPSSCSRSLHRRCLRTTHRGRLESRSGHGVLRGTGVARPLERRALIRRSSPRIGITRTKDHSSREHGSDRDHHARDARQRRRSVCGSHLIGLASPGWRWTLVVHARESLPLVRATQSLTAFRHFHAVRSDPTYERAIRWAQSDGRNQMGAIRRAQSDEFDLMSTLRSPRPGQPKPSPHMARSPPPNLESKLQPGSTRMHAGRT